MGINDGYKIGRTVYRVYGDQVKTYQISAVTLKTLSDGQLKFKYEVFNTDTKQSGSYEHYELYSTRYGACMKFANEHQMLADKWRELAINNTQHK